MSFLHTMFSDAPQVTTELVKDEEALQSELRALLAGYALKQQILARLLDGESVHLHLHQLADALRDELAAVEREVREGREILDDLKFLSREAYVRRLAVLRGRVGTAISRDAYLAALLGELRAVLAAQARKVQRLARAQADPGTEEGLINLLMIERDIAEKLSDVEDETGAYRNIAIGVRRERAVERIRSRFSNRLLERLRFVALGDNGVAYSTDGSYVSQLCARVFNHLEDGIAEAVGNGAITGHAQADTEFVESEWFERFVREEVREDAALGKVVPSERTIASFVALFRQLYLAQASSPEERSAAA